jgi:primosomal protein N' (replication factor Y)
MSVERGIARSARRFPTDAERRLWSRLRRHGIGWHFRRQHPVPPFVLDFACVTLHVAVEADGGEHAEPGRNAARDRFLTDRGWAVLRFRNNEILANTDGVMAVIQAACWGRAEAALQTPPPQPSPAERGRMRVR